MRPILITRQLLLSSAPVLLTILLVLWTLATAPFTSFGNRWAVYPALIVLSFTIFVHIALIVTRRPRSAFILYAVVHLCIQVYVWQLCLILLSKDWL